MTQQKPERVRGQFTGWHIFAILVVFFGVVVGVNVLMARFALSTFGGVTVENSYVASQHFNRWLDEAAKEKALGWSADVVRREDGRLEITLSGPGDGAVVTAEAWHPLGREADRMVAFDLASAGHFVSREALPAGRWTLRLKVEQGGNMWREEIALQ